MSGGYKMAQMEFLEVCSIGDVDKVKRAVQNTTVDPNYHHAMNGWTALHWAARRGHEQICELLIDAGFSKEARDLKGKTPYEVCLPCHRELRALLKPDSMGDMSSPSSPSSPSSSTRSSTSPVSSPGFVPSYIRHPAFPHAVKTPSLDAAPPLPQSPTTPPSPGGYYSYGRRDSLNRTRFLLVRTSCGFGKEAYKRITLPGGATVEQLKTTVEKALRMGTATAILTLPDRVLVEDISQIQQFVDCQKIEVIFEEKEPSPQPIGDREPAAERVSIAEEQSEKAAGSKQGSPDLNSNSKRAENKMDEQQLHDDSAPTSLVEIPSVDMPSVPDSIELDKLGEMAGGDDVQVESAEEKVKETEEEEEDEEAAGDVEDEESAPVSSVRSTDRESNNGDYVQVSAEDAPVDEQHAHVEHPVVPTPPSSPVPVEEEEEDEQEEEEEAEPEVAVEAKESSVPAEPSPVPETTVTPASPVNKEAPVVGEEQEKEEEEKPSAPAPVTVPLKRASPKAGLGKYIQDHPEMIKQAAIVGAVVGTVGVAIYAYRHIKAN